jgi:hypothetical protein
MNDYISRESLLERYRSKYPWETFSYYGSIQKFVKSLPAADVKPVVHAHWIMPNPNNDDRPMPECSNCGWYVDMGGVKDFTYCPNCGADMEGGGGKSNHD